MLAATVWSTGSSCCSWESGTGTEVVEVFLGIVADLGLAEGTTWSWFFCDVSLVIRGGVCWYKFPLMTTDPDLVASFQKPRLKTAWRVVYETVKMRVKLPFSSFWKQSWCVVQMIERIYLFSQVASKLFHSYYRWNEKAGVYLDRLHDVFSWLYHSVQISIYSFWIFFPF